MQPGQGDVRVAPPWENVACSASYGLAESPSPPSRPLARAGGLGCVRRGGLRVAPTEAARLGAGARLPQRRPLERDDVGGVDEAIADGVGMGGLPNQVVPAFD